MKTSIQLDPAHETVDEAVGQTLGRYELLEKLGTLVLPVFGPLRGKQLLR